MTKQRFVEGQLVHVRLPKSSDFNSDKMWEYGLGTVIGYHENVGQSGSPAYEVLIDGEKRLYRESSLGLPGLQCSMI